MFSLDSFVKAAKDKKIQIDAVMAVQDGKILGLSRFSDEIYHNVYSVAKSYLATGIGMAVDEGLLKLEDKPVDFFPDILPDSMDERWNKVSLYHLLTMTSGHGEQLLMARERKVLRGESDDIPGITDEMKQEWLIYAFTRPMVYEPGQQFSYGNLAPYVAGRMLEKAIGESPLDYLYERLWKPMGHVKPRWDPDPAGHIFPPSYLFLDITNMAALGEMYMNKGVYKGRRYLSEEWVQQATTVRVPSVEINPGGPAADEACGYGFYFWMNKKEGFRAYGREGQFVIVLPEKNAVIATQAMHSDCQAVLDLLWEHVEPQL